MMSRIYDWDLTVTGKAASQPNIKENRNGAALARNEGHIAVKWPGGKTYHSDGGYTTSYPPQVIVYEIRDVATDPDTGREKITVRCLLDWDTGRRKRGEPDSGQ